MRNKRESLTPRKIAFNRWFCEAFSFLQEKNMSDDNVLRVRLEVTNFDEYAAKMQRAEKIALGVNNTINSAGKNASFGKDVSAQFQMAERNADKFHTSLNTIGKNTTFARDLSVQFDQVERKTQSFGSSVKNAFGGFGLAVGASAAVGAAGKVLTDATKEEIAESEKHLSVIQLFCVAK